ncbi:hypothetical protein [Sphingomonas sp.]|uniref:hypothetical protein n=1 Tax=Sphingomonas sp. TaxID=28214 RepID=UPI00286CD08C|nr:hypothetical protein [Sphingomonas sp.]
MTVKLFIRKQIQENFGHDKAANREDTTAPEPPGAISMSGHSRMSDTIIADHRTIGAQIDRIAMVGDRGTIDGVARARGGGHCRQRRPRGVNVRNWGRVRRRRDRKQGGSCEKATGLSRHKELLQVAI